MNKPRDLRSSDLAKIHIAKKELGLSADDYTALLRAVCQVDSASKLDVAGRAKLLAHFRKIGWKPGASSGGRPATVSRPRPSRPTPSVDAAPLVRRIRAQLISLGNLPDSYADGIAHQMLGEQAPKYFEWCHLTDLYKISQALGVEQRRKGVFYGR